MQAQFDGSNYEAQKDLKRLTRQIEVIRDLMLDGEWRTLPEIAGVTGYLSSSISAQLRNLKKERFGGFTLEKRRRGEGGLWSYRLSRT